MLPKEQLPKVVQSLVNSWAVLVMAERKIIEDVPETYKILNTEYPLRSYVEIEIAERTIAALSQSQSAQ